MKKYVLFGFLLALQANAKQNDCHMFDSVKAPAAATKSIFDSTKTEERFGEIISQVTGLFAEDFNRLGVNLTIEKAWKDSTLNAYAQKTDAKNWSLHFYGGLFRNANVTDDGFALVVCHETGHLLGGAPFYNGSTVSVEGQADFWATSVCMKKFAAQYKKTAAVSNYRCDQHFINSDEDKNTCNRTALAGVAIATFFSQVNLTVKPDLNRINVKKLNYTYDLHPEAQCRLDTYVAGSLCDRDEVSTEKLLNERLTADSLCNDVIDGALAKVEKRPGCWFNEKIHVLKNNSKDTLKSHSIFGYKDGTIQLSFLPHAMGLYRVKIEADTADGSNEFVELKEHEFVYYKYPYALTGDFTVPFNFIKKANRNINFKVKIYLDETLYIEETIVIKAFSLS